jgi:hypothetical protein
MMTAAMIAMFYLGTVSGVLGAVLMYTLKSGETQKVEPLGKEAAPDGFGRAA